MFFGQKQKKKCFSNFYLLTGLVRSNQSFLVTANTKSELESNHLTDANAALCNKPDAKGHLISE